jgi:hypothetical protein
MFPSRILVSAVLLVLATAPAPAADLPLVRKVELQPLSAQVKRVVDALDLIGAPLPDADKKRLDEAAADRDEARAVVAIQAVLDRLCLAGIRIRGEEAGPPRLEIQTGPAPLELAEQGWRVVLIKVANPAGIDKLELRPDSPNALPLYSPSTGRPDPKVISTGEVSKRFLDLVMFNTQPLVRDLSGLELEYRVLQIYCRDPGRKEVSLGFGLWDHNALGRPNRLVAASPRRMVTAESAPAVLVQLHLQDDDGHSEHHGVPVMGAFVFRDARGRVYPSQSRRLAPDFGFHPQVYRADGETISLQPGKYRVTWTRGPEYLVLDREITVPAAPTHAETFRLKRWINPAAAGWYSGDHHIHAAGCAHYESPSEGVAPSDMMRHVLGEDLDVGCCLSWGPCWYHQKRYFEGKVNALSTPEHLLRYDVEVSGFPSSHCGHICLLRLRQQDYPGTKLIEDWPSWDLPIFRWAKSQGAVVGFAHSGWGLDVPTSELPNYVVPPMNGIGANEYLVDVAHGMCDFISTVDTPSVWELNVWYHTLNCGYRCRISGETDFPCIYGERVGLGRSYVHLDGKLNFDDWTEGVRQGRCYVSDGKSHLLDFKVDDTPVGLRQSEVRLDRPGMVKVTATVAALLEPQPTAATERVRKTPLNQKPYWDVERARVGDTRNVPVEVVVNGVAVERKEVAADGTEHLVTFEVPIKESSWVCLRVFPSSHTNPVWVVVDGKPVRTSKRSARWCLAALDRCWQQKAPHIREQERAEAKRAYDDAREKYQKVLAECAEE